jgi:D-glycero-D-manno-heptose 1,7-bisphosphate phosphatase
MDRHWAAYEAGGRPCLVTVYTNKDGYTRNSVKVEGDRLAVFDKSRTTPGLQGVEISYALLDRDTVLDLLPERDALPEGDELFEVAVYPELARRGDLTALVTDHRYFSVGSLERLPITERFFARTPTVILDRDGVLNRKPPRAHYVRSPAEWEWLPGALEALVLLHDAGYRVAIVSNQAGIARGAMTEGDLERVHEAMYADVSRAGGHIDALYYCPHGWDDDCECRKPKPGMLFQAQRDLDLDLSRTLFIGDDDRDGEAAAAAGCRFAQVTDTTSLMDLVEPLARESASSRSRQLAGEQ